MYLLQNVLNRAPLITASAGVEDSTNSRGFTGMRRVRPEFGSLRGQGFNVRNFVASKPVGSLYFRGFASHFLHYLHFKSIICRLSEGAYER